MICVRTGAETASHFSSSGRVMAKLRRAQHTARPADVVGIAALARRISALGTVSAALTGLVLCAIVQDALTAPDPRRAADGSARHTAAPSGHRGHRSGGGGHAPVVTSPRGTLDRTVRKAVTAKARRLSTAPGSDRPVVHTDRRDVSRTWAFGTSLLAAHDGGAQMNETDLFLAHRPGKHWRIGLAGSAEFRRLLREVPSSVLTADERATLAAYDDGFTPSHGRIGGTATGPASRCCFGRGMLGRAGSNLSIGLVHLRCGLCGSGRSLGCGQLHVTTASALWAIVFHIRLASISAICVTRSLL